MTRNKNGADSKKYATAERRRMLLGILETSQESLDVMTILVELKGKDPSKFQCLEASGIRKVKRDLQELEQQGLVEESDGKWRVRGGSSAIQQLADAVGFEVLKSAATWAVPESVMEDLNDRTSESTFKLKAGAFSGNPAVRWLRALKVGEEEHPVFEFDRPRIDPDVREAVEQAILEGKKIRLTTWNTGKGTPDGRRIAKPIVASISHYILRLPDMASIGCWDDNGAMYIEEGLENFLAAEVLDEPAEFTVDPSLPRPRIEKEVFPVEMNIKVRLDQIAIREWRKKVIWGKLEEQEQDEGGLLTCSFRARYSSPLIDFLIKNSPHVEVLSPETIRNMVHEHGLMTVAMYSPNPNMREAVIRERQALDCYLG